MPLVLGGSSAAAGAFSVDNSCRFNPGDSPYLNRTIGTPTLATKGTVSFWAKLAGSSEMYAVGATQNSTNKAGIGFGHTTAGALTIIQEDSGANTTLLRTNRLFRDVGAWYHIVVAFDTPQVTDTNRVKLYVNGVQETSFASTTYPAQDSTIEYLEDGQELVVGTKYGSSYENFFNGYLAEVVLIDGTAYAASDFGEFSEDSPTIWMPKKVSGLIFGDQGYYLDFKDSANLGNDATGGIDFGENNIVAVDQCVDSPTNNFATVNSLDNYYPGVTFSEGNTQIVTPASNVYAPTTCSVGLIAGKWYWELKPTTMPNNEELTGIASTQATSAAGDELGDYPNDWAYYANNGNSYNDSTSTSYGDSYTVNDIIGVALDITNSKLYFSKNGVWQNSGDPTSGATGTGAISITAVASTPLGTWFPAQTYWHSTANTVGVNYGNPPYANTSDAADENGYGKFEYAPPSGYLAICTKNLGSDGG